MAEFPSSHALGCRHVLHHAAPEYTPFIRHVHSDPCLRLSLGPGEDTLIDQQSRREDYETLLKILSCQDLEEGREVTGNGLNILNLELQFTGVCMNLEVPVGEIKSIHSAFILCMHVTLKGSSHLAEND